MDNRAQAADSFKDAIRIDPLCQEALQALVKHQMLSAKEEMEVIDNVPFNKACDNDEEHELLQFLYGIGTKKYDKPQDLTVPLAIRPSLTQNVSLEVALAERHYYNCDYNACCEISTAVMKKDPFHEGCLPIHISCLVELKQSNGKYCLFCVLMLL